MTDKAINEAVKTLRNGGVIAYPTESVYGLGCDPTNIESIKRLLKLKQRQRDKGLILIASKFAQLAPYLVDIDERLREPVLASWPGPVTWLWPTNESVSRWLRGQHDTLAVRVSAHPIAAQLCEEFDGALISTSANRSSDTPAHTAKEVHALFPDIDYILEAEVGGMDSPSEIRDILSGEIIRPA